MLTHVYLWKNGMVMVFDEKGEQVTDYQGRLPDVRANILADAPETCIFHNSEWQGIDRVISRSEFEAVPYTPPLTVN